MRKEALQRRSDELKARMLAERNPDAQKKRRSTGTRESASSANPSDEVGKVGEISSTERSEVAALKKRIAQLVAENESLRRQLASTNYQEPSPSRSNDDSVREQRHNFFTYSNLTRY
jgi:TolA-binding protein